MQNTPKQLRKLLEEALEDMASRGSSYSLANFNGALRGLSSNSTQDEKSKVTDIAAKAFGAGTSCILYFNGCWQGLLTSFINNYQN
jgi:hypothetical protein